MGMNTSIEAPDPIQVGITVSNIGPTVIGQRTASGSARQLCCRDIPAFGHSDSENGNYFVYFHFYIFIY
jgi:hypothetical protein